MDAAELVRLAQRVYARLYEAEQLSREEIIQMLGSADAYQVVCWGLNHIRKAEGRRGPTGGLIRVSHAQQGFTDRHLRSLQEYFNEHAAEDAHADADGGGTGGLLSGDAERLRRLLETEGGTLGRREIMESLGLSEDQYDEASAELVSSNVARKNRGRSGGLSLLEPTVDENARNVRAETGRAKERELYPPFTAYLEEGAKEGDFSRSVVLETHRTRQRKWETPDLTEVRVTPFPMLGQWELRVATYELKRADAWTIDSVLQTATYNEFAHESWLVVPSGDDGDWVNYFTPRVVDRAGGFGIGLATFSEETGVMKKHMVARRQLPDLAKLHEWLEEVVDRLRRPELKKDIANNIAWAKRKAEAGRD